MFIRPLYHVWGQWIQCTALHGSLGLGLKATVGDGEGGEEQWGHDERVNRGCGKNGGGAVV